MGANSGPTTYRVGLGNVGSYQVSGVPWITGSSALGAGVEVGYELPMVSKSITVINRSAEDIRVHFNSTGSGRVVDGNHFVLFDSKEDSYTFNVTGETSDQTNVRFGGMLCTSGPVTIEG